MKIAFLCKRRYTGSDVIADRFGRLYEIPYQLSRLGHNVRGYCLDYHQRGKGTTNQEQPGVSFAWESRSLGAARLPGMLWYPWHLLQRLRRFSPTLLIGASDLAHVALTAWLARRIGIPYAIDLYDNFESFGMARLPGLAAAYRRAVRGAGLVTVVSEPLRLLVEREYGARGPVMVMVNGVDPLVFRRIDRREARHSLGLPDGAPLIGTAGGLYRSKGLATLYDAWDRVAAARSNVHLVLAGPTEEGLAPPQGDRVHYMGQLPQARMAELFNALDVGVITVRDSAFGRYCFPQKLHEMLACGLPIVATDVGAVAALLESFPQVLYGCDDAAALAGALLRQIEAPVLPEVPVQTWPQLVAGLEPALRVLDAAARRG